MDDLEGIDPAIDDGLLYKPYQDQNTYRLRAAHLNEVQPVSSAMAYLHSLVSSLATQDTCLLYFVKPGCDKDTAVRDIELDL